MPRPTPKGRSTGRSGPSKGAKSAKADGTPKVRWTPEQRAAAGLAPRRSGGRERLERNDRGDRAERFERADRSRDTSGGRGGERTDSFRARDERGAESRSDGRGGGRPWDEQRTDERSRGERRWNQPERRWDADERSGDQRLPGARRDARGEGERREGPRGDGERAEGPRRDDRRTDSARDDQWRGRRDDRGADQGESREQRRPAWGRAEAARFQGGEIHPRPERAQRRGGGETGRRPWRDDRHWDDERPVPGRQRAPRAASGSFEDERSDTMEWSPATEVVELPSEQPDAAEGEFAALGVPSALVRALTRQGISHPFPIQTATLPDAMAGRDVLGRGRTGSGKTLAFGLPLLVRLAEAEPAGGLPRAMILEPTRELALQVADVLSPLARTLGLEVTLIAGGMSYGPQLRAFERGVDVVVATPGRLIDLLEQGATDLSRVLISVLDEADHMADLGFMPAVTTLLDAVPADGQRLLFSATLDRAVDTLVRAYLHDPVTHEVDTARASVTTMTHRLLAVRPSDKVAVTAEIAGREGRTLIFARTQLGANRLAEQLREAGVMTGALHGGLTQGARARVMAAFKRGDVPVLVATDVAARGIHVDDVSLVLQVDPPMHAKDYLHRAGRTARAGEQGVVATLVLPHQRRGMVRMASMVGVELEPIPVTPRSDELAALTGARPGSGAPIAEADYQAVIAPAKAAPRPSRGGRWQAPRRENRSRHETRGR